MKNEKKATITTNHTMFLVIKNTWLVYNHLDFFVFVFGGVFGLGTYLNREWRERGKQKLNFR